MFIKTGKWWSWMTMFLVKKNGVTFRRRVLCEKHIRRCFWIQGLDKATRLSNTSSGDRPLILRESFREVCVLGYAFGHLLGTPIGFRWFDTGTWTAQTQTLNIILDLLVWWLERLKNILPNASDRFSWWFTMRESKKSPTKQIQEKWNFTQQKTYQI